MLIRRICQILIIELLIPIGQHRLVIISPSSTIRHIPTGDDFTAQLGTLPRTDIYRTPTYHDGQLSPVVGVHNIQLVRANREHPDVSNGGGWTYNHQPMLAYWNEQFYYQYLADPSDEHIPPSQTFLMTSKDGYNWTNPEIVFPPYKVPDGYTKTSRPLHRHRSKRRIRHA